MNKIAGQKISDFLENLSSSKPTPGGGAVAALSGALAAALCCMVVNLSKNETGVKMERLGALRKRLLELADEDVEAFNKVMQAYRQKDKPKIIFALKTATAVPVETARLASMVGKIARILAEKGNKKAYSDARSAFHLARAARYSALENIRINQKSLIAMEKQKK